jgi:hypothetical protein
MFLDQSAACKAIFVDTVGVFAPGFQDWNTGDISMNNWLIGILAFGAFVRKARQINQS